ncbi:MAG: TauD/TfdA family dioxygenase [Rhizomicrobium sp.]
MSSAALKIQTENSPLSVQKLSPVIGAEVGDIDLRQPLSPEIRDELRRLLLAHKVLFFRNQDISYDQHLAFARNFGELYDHPTGGLDKYRTIQPIDAREFAKHGYDIRKITGTPIRAGASIRLLVRSCGLQIFPMSAGDTIWANGGAILRGMPAELRDKIDSLYVIHDYQDALKKSGVRYPLVAHPIIRTHPETGEDIFWVNWSLKPRNRRSRPRRERCAARAAL